MKPMITLYVEITDHLSSLGFIFLDDLLLSSSDDNKISDLMEKMETIDIVTDAFHTATLSILNTRILFDTVIAKFLQLQYRFGSSASIGHSSKFEPAICKLMTKRLMDLSDDVQESVCSLLLQTGSNESLKDHGLLLAEIAEKMVCGEKNHCDEYIDIRLSVAHLDALCYFILTKRCEKYRTPTILFRTFYPIFDNDQVLLRLFILITAHYLHYSNYRIILNNLFTLIFLTCF